MTRHTLGLTLVLALAATGATAQTKDRAAVLQSVVGCRTVADSAARLACYDDAAAKLDEAEAKGDLVVMDREQTRQARREAFGFSIPTFDLFNRGEAPEKLDRESFKVARAWEGGDAKWRIELDTGAIWRQTDSEHLSRRPKPGTIVEIRSGAIGSYLMNVDGQRAIRVTRDK